MSTQSLHLPTHSGLICNRPEPETLQCPPTGERHDEIQQQEGLPVQQLGGSSGGYGEQSKPISKATCRLTPWVQRPDHDKTMNERPRLAESSGDVTTRGGPGPFLPGSGTRLCSDGGADTVYTRPGPSAQNTHRSARPREPCTDINRLTPAGRAP